MCHALLHSSTLSRALAASLLLCIYVSVVLLSFTHSKNPPLTSAQAEALAAANGKGSSIDRTFVTAIWAEEQLPALIALAHSLMQTRSEFGLLLLLPTGAPAAERGAAHSSSRNRRRAPVRRATTVTTRRKRKNGKISGGTDSLDDDDAASAASSAASSNSGGEVVHAWSEDTLAVLRAIPNLTLQLLPHVRFPPPQSSVADTRVLASEGSFSTGQAAQADVSFTSAVRTLLLFEVWRLTDYRQVLYIDVNSIVQRNIDHLLAAETIEAVPLGAALAKQRGRKRRRKHQPKSTTTLAAVTTMMATVDEAAPAVTTLSSSPASASAAPAAADSELDDESDERQRRAAVVDTGLERWLHAHSMHEAHLPTPMPDAASTSPVLASSADGSSHSFHAHLASIDWADAVAHSTPAYLQLAAPMQLAREDCARFDAVAQQCARDFDAEEANHDHSPSAVAAAAAAAAGDGAAASKPPSLEAFSIAGHTSLLSPSLAWSLFNSNLLLLSPNAYTYHLLLQSYTHTHVERRDRFDPRHFEHRLDRIKYGNYPAKILNHFFARPCAASSSGTGHAGPAETAAASATSSAASSPLSAPSSGCWHPLRLNLSLTSHTCGCLDDAALQSAETQPVLRYTACATPGRLNPWLLLPSGVAHTLRECDQLTIRGGSGGADAEAEAADRERRAPPAAPAAAADDPAASSLPPGFSPLASSSDPSTPTGSGSYYSALLSSLSWLLGSSAERASHRFAELYLREQETKAREALDAAQVGGGNRTAAQAAAAAEAAVPEEDQLSPCCHAQYGRVLQTYFAALRFIRPNFDESQQQTQQQANRNKHNGGKNKRRGRG